MMNIQLLRVTLLTLCCGTLFVLLAWQLWRASDAGMDEAFRQVGEDWNAVEASLSPEWEVLERVSLADNVWMIMPKGRYLRQEDADAAADQLRSTIPTVYQEPSQPLSISIEVIEIPASYERVLPVWREVRKSRKSVLWQIRHSGGD